MPAKKVITVSQIKNLLTEHRNNVKEVAKALGISYQAIYVRIGQSDTLKQHREYLYQSEYDAAMKCLSNASDAGNIKASRAIVDSYHKLQAHRESIKERKFRRELAKKQQVHQHKMDYEKLAIAKERLAHDTNGELSIEKLLDELGFDGGMSF